MSKYNRFEDFMQEVINESDRKCRSRYGKSLTEAFKVGTNTATVIKAIIDKGWWVLIALATLLALGGWGFAAAVTAFCVSPPGLIIVAVLAGFGIGGVRVLYKERVLPLAVKETGNQYKSEYENHINEISYIDRLTDRASDTLLYKATGK